MPRNLLGSVDLQSLLSVKQIALTQPLLLTHAQLNCFSTGYELTSAFTHYFIFTYLDRYFWLSRTVWYDVRLSILHVPKNQNRLAVDDGRASRVLCNSTTVDLVMTQGRQ